MPTWIATFNVAGAALATNPQVPLANANITWPGGNIVTDAQGNATTPALPDTGGNIEAVTFSCSYTGYSSSQVALGGPPDQAYAFVLQPAGLGTISCFIVSAATGSPDSAEVRRMQQMRARVAGLSALTSQLIAEILREYYQFSPGIAADLEKDEAARTAVLETVVRPLMAWYALAITLGLELSDANAVERHVQDVLDACVGDYGKPSIAAVLEGVRSGKPLRQDVPEVILPFMGLIREVARLRTASWAILDPLVRISTLRARQANMIDEVSEWLASAPLETLEQPKGPDVLDAEFKTLSGFFDFRPAARRRLGSRLAAAWPEVVPALTRNSFI